MFTGLVEEVGVIQSVVRKSDSLMITVTCKTVVEDCNIGDSIAINGACQTVTQFSNNSFTVDTLRMSLDKTNLGNLTMGARVNLERALTMGKPLGGHFVTGHVQEKARIRSIRQSGENLFLRVELSNDLMRYMVKEGSITIDGVSLTISDIKQNSVEINVIPLTCSDTIIGEYRVGQWVNIEPDILVKTVKKDEGLTMEKLKSWGY